MQISGLVDSGGRPLIPRNVASAMRAPGQGTGGISNGTDTTTNYRSGHFNETGQTVTSLALIYCGWYVENAISPNNGAEGDLPNSYTITASIEYPVGTFNQVTWSSATSKVIAPGDTTVSDTIQLSTPIPPNTQFFIRGFTVVSSGGKWPTGYTLSSADSGESGIGLTDKTLGGTISGSYSGNRPNAAVGIVPYAKKLCLAGLGDSIMTGSGDGGFDSHGNTAWLGRAATGICPFQAISVVGVGLAAQAVSGKMNRRLALLRKSGITDAVLAWGINDAGTAAQLLANALNVASQVSALGIRVWYTTLTAQASDTIDKWYTTINQVPGSNLVRNGQFSDSLRLIPWPLTGIIENADASMTARNSGIWKAGNSQTAFLTANTDAWVVGGSPTTTSIPSNANKSADYYRFGSVYFTTGALTGQIQNVSGQTSGGTFTVNAFPSAPAPGDLFNAYPITCSSTGDGLHPNNQGSGFGGHFILKNNVIPLLNSLNN